MKSPSRPSVALRPPRLDLNPSAAERWTTCTASPQFIMDNWSLIPPQDTKFSQEGTTAHEVAAAYLEDREILLDDCPTGIDGDMRWFAWEYAEYVKSLFDGNTHSEIIVEQKFPLWYMENRNAKIDAAVINKEGIHIVDYKYGEGVPVHPENNLQCAIYGRVIGNTIKDLKDNCPFSIHIYQPRGRESIHPHHVWGTTWGELKRFTDLLVTQPAMSILNGHMFPDGKPQFRPSEKACQWCPAKGFCTARQESLLDGIEALSVIPETPRALPSPQTLSPEQRSAIQKSKKLIEKWLKDVEEYNTESMIGLHQELPGFKVVLSNGGHRFWTDEQKAKQLLLGDTILKRDEVITEKVITPAQAEKLIGKLPVDLFNLVGKPQGSPVIAPEGDKREAYLANLGSEFDNLNESVETDNQ